MSRPDTRTRTAIARARWLAPLLLWAVMLLLTFVLMERGDYGGGDFRLYYTAARDYLPQRMPYFSVIGQLSGSLNYPPFLPQLLMPIAKTLDAQSALRLWFIANVVSLLGLLVVLAQFVPARSRLTFWVLTAFYLPVFDSLRFGQINVLLLVLIGLAWACIRRGRPTLAGVLLACAAWIKIYPALILVFLLWKRQWRAAASGIISGVAIAGLQIAISGTAVFEELVRSLALLAAQGERHLMWQNSSIQGFASRLFEANPRVIPLLESRPLLLLATGGLILLVLVSLFWLTRRPPSDTPPNAAFDLEFALCVLTMLLISPWVYPDTLSLCLIAIVALWACNPHGKAAFALLFLGIGIVSTYGTTCAADQSCPAITLSTGFFSLFALWLYTAASLVRLNRRSLTAATRP